MAADELQSKSETVATVEQIELAVKNLTVADLAKLHAFARNRAKMMRLYGSPHDEQDLLGDAVLSLLEERRHWNPKKVNFVGVLIGAMRSIASNYRDTAKRVGHEVSDSQLEHSNEDGDSVSPLACAEVVGTNAEEAAISSDLIGKVEDILADDPEALVIMDGWRDGMSGAEIIEALELSRTAYETIVRRIRRQVEILWPKGTDNVR